MSAIITEPPVRGANRLPNASDWTFELIDEFNAVSAEDPLALAERGLEAVERDRADDCHRHVSTCVPD